MKYLFLLLFIVSQNDLCANEFVTSKPFKLKWSGEPEYVGQYNGLVYFLTGKQTRKTYWFMGFDFKSLRWVSKKVIKMNDSKEMIKTISMDGQILTIYTSENKHYRMDCETMEMLGEDAISKVSEKHFDFIVYPNSDDKRNENMKKGAFLFRDIFFDYHVTSPKQSEQFVNFYVHTNFINNTYYKNELAVTLYELGDSIQNEKTKEFVLGDNKSILEIYQNNINADVFSLYGKYLDKEKKMFGYFQAIFDTRLNQKGSTSMLEFTTSASMNNAELELKITSFVNSMDDYREKVIVKNSIIYIEQDISERQILVTKSRSTPNGGISSSVDRETECIGKFIYILNFCQNGQVFYYEIPLKQRTYTYNSSVGFNLAITEDTMSVYFYDNQRNEDIKEGEMPKECNYSNKCNMYKMNLNVMNGQMSERNLCLRKSSSNGFFPMYRILLTEEMRNCVHIFRLKPESNFLKIERYKY